MLRVLSMHIHPTSSRMQLGDLVDAEHVFLNLKASKMRNPYIHHIKSNKQNMFINVPKWTPIFCNLEPLSINIDNILHETHEPNISCYRNGP